MSGFINNGRQRIAPSQFFGPAGGGALSGFVFTSATGGGYNGCISGGPFSDPIADIGVVDQAFSIGPYPVTGLFNNNPGSGYPTFILTGVPIPTPNLPWATISKIDVYLGAVLIKTYLAPFSYDITNEGDGKFFYGFIGASIPFVDGNQYTVVFTSV